MRVQAAFVLCLVLLLRLPFLNQAIQGDDFYYLKGAEHALIDPLHPTHAQYVFQGRMVDMRGHPHPPLNAGYLGLLVALFHDESEVPLHAGYVVFSLIAAFSALVIARKFSTRPLAATVLFLVTPAFVVNGNSLESDLPFVAFWLASVALFIHERWWMAVAASALAALAAYQAIVLAPVLGWHLLRHRRVVRAWIAVLAAPLTIVVWQIYERLSSGALPAGVLAGYMQTYNLQAFTQKLKSAAALTGHTGWLVFPVLSLLACWRGPKWVRIVAAVVTVAGLVADPNPLFWISCGVGALVIFWSASEVSRRVSTRHAGVRAPRGDEPFLCWWIVVFFAAALALFFAGSARYLLPIALPVAILVSNRLDTKWLVAGTIAEAVIGLGLAVVNYQHWDGYRQFARSLEPEIQRHRTWTNAEWGLRHYLESEGVRPVEDGRALWPNDLLITTAYGSTPQTAASAPFAEREITSRVPLRIVALGADSGYSSVAFGLAPFAISLAPIDRVRAVLISDRRAELSALNIGTPEAAAQIVSGVYNNDRWTAERATVALKRPATAQRIEAAIFIPPQSPARTIGLYVDGKLAVQQTYPGAGRYVIGAAAAGGEQATVTLAVDKTFSVPGDQRQLGVLLLSIGFR